MNDRTTPPAGDSHVTDQVCLDVLSRALSRDALRGIVEHFRRCPECETRFRRISAEYEILRASPGPRTTADGVLELPRDAGGPDSASGILRLFRPRPLAAAAVLAAAVLLVVLLPRSPRTEPAYRLPSYADPVHLRTEAAAPEDFTAGLRAYEDGDDDRAAALLQTASVPPSLDPMRRLYLSGALTAEGRFADALDALGSLEENAFPYPWDGEFLWIRYLALEGAGQDVDAARLLDVLSRREGKIGDLARKRGAELNPDRR